MDSKHETSKLIEEEPATATRRYSVTKKFVPAARKLTVAEEVGKKLARMQNKKPKEFLEICFREFDQACSLQVSELRDTFDEALVQLSDDCDMMEKNLTSLLIWKQNTTKARVDQATAERNNERKEKLNLAKWMAMFTPQDKKNTKADEVDFAYIRFCLNMAIAADVCPVQKQLDSGTPEFLSSMLTVDNDCVVGPASMALANLSTHVETKKPIALSGGIENCVKLVNNNPNAPIVTQCCKVLASVAMLPTNKTYMAGKGAIKALVNIVKSVGPDNYRVDDAALGSAFCGLCNCAEGSDANRNLIVELDVMNAIEYICENWTDAYVLASASKLICNLAFNNVYTALSCLAAHCDEALSTSIKKSGGDKFPDVGEAAMMAYCNLANNESNQTHVGSTGAIELAVKTLELSNDVRVLTAAAMACASMAFKSFINKTRMGDAGAIKALLEVAIGRGNGGASEEEQEDAKCAEACCKALATLLLNSLNQQKMKELGAIEVFVQAIGETESMEVLQTGSMVICALVPLPDAKKRLLIEGRRLPVEEAGGKEVLVRCKQWVYGRKPSPEWLNAAMEVLDIKEEEAIKEQREREIEAERLVADDLFMDNRAVSSGVTPNSFRPEFYSHLELFREAVATPKKDEIGDELVELVDILF